MKKFFRAKFIKKLLLKFLDFKFSHVIGDKLYLKIKYLCIMDRKLNLKTPRTFNEKIQWLKIYDRKKNDTDQVDKVLVREFVARTIGSEFLIPIYGVYSSYDEINFNDLPNQFVLKPNHTSGDVYICKNKNLINHSVLKKTIRKWMRINYYWKHREFAYKNIKPKILCEKLLIGDNSSDLMDYKLMVFNSKVKCTFVTQDRHKEDGLKMDFFDRNWNFMPFTRKYPNTNKKIQKPILYEKMVELAEKLSCNRIFVRVDFYFIENKIFFGELTLHPGSGFEKFEPTLYDNMLGEWIDLRLLKEVN
ncbi:MAG: hypothetical protein K8Q99_05075 [Acholeplasmataceae bacterium]|nr:hypothetical protein [Acholeplasmataceae bacterium]